MTQLAKTVHTGEWKCIFLPFQKNSDIPYVTDFTYYFTTLQTWLAVHLNQCLLPVL